MNELFNRNPAPPPCRFQIGARGELGDITQTEIGQHFDRPGDPEYPLHRSMVQNADPSDADSFGPCGKPEILDRATRAVQVCLAHRGTPQHVQAATPAAAGHTEIDRRFLDSFELEPPVEFSLGACISACCLGVGIVEQIFHRAFGRTIANDHKIPRLHEPHGAGMVGRRQQPR